MIDSHTHLDIGPRPVEELVDAAATAGVGRMVTVGTDPASCRAALAAAERHPGVYAAVGHHPHEAGSFDAGVVEELAEMARHPRCVAVGETGLDYLRSGAPADVQRQVFLAQVDLAAEVGKPLVIHTREAAQDTLEILRGPAAGLRVMLHCFGLAEHLEECLEQGWWLSFAGNLTYPSATALRYAAAAAPDERLLVETDAPYLAPQPVRGQRNEPAFVVHTARALAEVRGMELAALEHALDANAATLFGW